LTLPLPEIRRFVRDLAAREGRRVLARWSEVGELSYKDRRDVATEVDVEIEESLRAALLERFPDHGFHGEETGSHNAGAELAWRVDPIDGTKYYAGGSSLFAISIALAEADEPILGVIHEPTTGRTFHASRDGGAALGERPLEGPPERPLHEAILNFDSPGSDRLSPTERAFFEAKLVALSRRAYRLRALGITSLAACWVATGAFDAHLDLTGYATPEDTAASRVILAEIGCRVEELDVGAGPPRLLAARPALFDELRALLAGENPP